MMDSIVGVVENPNPKWGSYGLGERSQAVIAELCPELQLVARAIIRYEDFAFYEGHRGLDAQNIAVADDKSDALFGQSGHNYVPSFAMHALVVPIDWDDYKTIRRNGGLILGVAATLGIDLIWGGNWKRFDGGHFELRGWQERVKSNGLKPVDRIL
jgi:peptidoglycan L-alanyl-D-glutamate endopeptidase CwlK